MDDKYLCLTVHKGYVSFRTPDGRYGSNPGTLADNLKDFVTVIMPGVTNIEILYA
jgi:glycyl-tRNA synthetase alpha subunit